MSDMTQQHSTIGEGDESPESERSSFTHPAWLQTAVFYEIYPQSFYDSNGDGIGDLQGIIEKLDYISALGCNALWINPCFDSPFKDAGYDVRDYRRVASRYGTNGDLVRLFQESHRRGIHVLLDLVPGHTSEEHTWFERSKQAEHNPYSDRYIWTDSAFHGYTMPFVGGESDRDATYILNFFKCQPALNFGFAKRDRPWQQTPDSPAARRTQDAMIDVMRFWLGQGCDGFRVDMANSLVKNDGDDKPETIRAWQHMLGAVKTEFPESAFVCEWGVPAQSFEAGFDMDFYLDWRWDGKGNGYNLLLRDVDDALDSRHDHSYFNARGGGSIHGFLDQYLPQYEESKSKGYFSLITGNHDTPRLAPRLDQRERAIAYGMIMTMPGVPFLYYGDEIGMRYRTLPTKEGGYARTGSRTPMQWDGGRNLGFSSAPGNRLYLPVERTPDAPNVTEQLADEHSLLRWMGLLVSTRHDHEALRAGSAFHTLAAPEHGRAFVYLRGSDSGERLVVAMNPGLHEEKIDLSVSFDDATGYHANEDGRAPLLLLGCQSWHRGELTMGPQSFAVFAVDR